MDKSIDNTIYIILAHDLNWGLRIFKLTETVLTV